jgi:hypothetical protein
MSPSCQCHGASWEPRSGNSQTDALMSNTKSCHQLHSKAHVRALFTRCSHTRRDLRKASRSPGSRPRRARRIDRIALFEDGASRQRQTPLGRDCSTLTRRPGRARGSSESRRPRLCRPPTPRVVARTIRGREFHHPARPGVCPGLGHPGASLAPASSRPPAARVSDALPVLAYGAPGTAPQHPDRRSPPPLAVR